MFRIGIDLGGTKIEGVALDAQGRELGRRRIATEAEGGPAHIVSRIAGLYAGLVYLVDDAPHTLGVGTPGAISKKTGLLKNSNTVCLNGQPLPAMLEAALRHPLRVENDANCFALAEALMGAGQGYDCVFGVIMGTGCGGGIVIDGRVRTGPQAIAGEWGHMVIDPAGPPCYCGARGCVESFISGGGLEKGFLRRFGRQLDAAAIVTGADAGDIDCKAAMDDFYANFGQALANLMAVLDPDIVILGGGMSNIDPLYSRGIDEVRKRIFSDELATPVVRNALGDSAGSTGSRLAGCLDATPADSREEGDTGQQKRPGRGLGHRGRHQRDGVEIDLPAALGRRAEGIEVDQADAERLAIQRDGGAGINHHRGGGELPFRDGERVDVGTDALATRQQLDPIAGE